MVKNTALWAEEPKSRSSRPRRLKLGTMSIEQSWQLNNMLFWKAECELFHRPRGKPAHSLTQSVSQTLYFLVQLFSTVHWKRTLGLQLMSVPYYHLFPGWSSDHDKHSKLKRNESQLLLWWQGQRGHYTANCSALSVLTHVSHSQHYILIPVHHNIWAIRLH